MLKWVVPAVLQIDQGGALQSAKSLCGYWDLFLVVYMADSCSESVGKRSRSSTPSSQPTMFLELVEIGRQYEYTIPSFSAITVNLRHVVAMHPDYVWEKNKQALKLLGMFVGDDPVVLSGRNSGIIRVLKGCIVNVSCLSH